MRVKVARIVAMAVAVGLLITVQSSPSRAAVGFSFNWNGTPAAPTAWSPSTGFDLVIHDRDLTGTWDRPTGFQAQHGSDCSPFQGFEVGGTHLVTKSYADAKDKAAEQSAAHKERREAKREARRQKNG